MAKQKNKPVRPFAYVSWAKTADGFVPHYRIGQMQTLGPECPFPRFLEGERDLVARYFLARICESLFGQSPLLFLQEDDMMDSPHPNPEWDTLPFMIEDENTPLGWRMNNGDIDVIGDFDILDQPVGRRSADGGHANAG